MRTIALFTTETMADWEYAYLTTQIAGAEQLKPGRFRLLLVGDGLAPVRTLGDLPLVPEADLDALDALAEEGSLAALVIPGGDHYEAGHDRLIEAVGRLVDQEIPVAAICGATFLLARGGFLDERRHTWKPVDTAVVPTTWRRRWSPIGVSPRHQAFMRSPSPRRLCESPGSCPIRWPTPGSRSS